MKRISTVATFVLLLALLLTSMPALAWSPQSADPSAWGDDFDIGDVVRTVNAEEGKLVKPYWNHVLGDGAP